MWSSRSKCPERCLFCLLFPNLDCVSVAVSKDPSQQASAPFSFLGDAAVSMETALGVALFSVRDSPVWSLTAGHYHPHGAFIKCCTLSRLHKAWTSISSTHSDDRAGWGRSGVLLMPINTYWGSRHLDRYEQEWRPAAWGGESPPWLGSGLGTISEACMEAQEMSKL